jgi:hypothetical protein
MEIEIGRYQFHSWSRKGIASRITDPDDLGEETSTGSKRVEIILPVVLNEEARSKNFALIGPGDVIGINRDMIVRSEPLPRITNFEPNYLVFLEFYDEDFAWRYTPAAPIVPPVGSPTTPYQPSKLRPWVFLLVLKEDEYERTDRRVPLPSVVIRSADALPPANETWLWAHVHSNADIPDADLTDEEKFLISLNKTVDDDPDQLYCRLLSPRKLEPGVAYRAFLIPAFETGRLAGLGLPTDNVNSQLASWREQSTGTEMPVYYEWSFRTGENADFESLVKALKPLKMDQRVGIRDMDCHDPAFMKADGTIPFPGTEPTVIGLEGALKSPETVSTVFPTPDDADEFGVELEKLINLPITILGTNASGDPVIPVPLYGGKHAKKSLTETVVFDRQKDTWLNQLNRDPRTRSAAGFGTLVIQENQETYMRKAWQQVTDVIKANRLIRLTQFHMNVTLGFTRQTFSKLPPTSLLALSKPVLSRIMGSPTTIYHQIQASQLPAVVFSGAFRRALRPGNTKKLSPEARFDFGQLVRRLNDGELTAAPPRTAPAATPNVKDLAGRIFQDDLPSWLKWVIEYRTLLLAGLLLLFLVLAVATASYVLFGILTAAAIGGYFYANRISNRSDLAAALVDPEKELASIAATPARPAFTLRLSDETATPSPTATSSGADSVEAKNFREAAIDLTRRFVVEPPVKEVKRLDLENAYQKVSAAIHPTTAFPRRLSRLVKGPANIDMSEAEQILPVMAYPDFDDPMYKKLTEISSELLLPNLELIPQNCISLLKTNPGFIESYLVGLNHEMGRELLWREYPTDERGSYFRQFWDVKGIIRPSSNTDNTSPAELAEKYKDIERLDTWLTDSVLGEHNNRGVQGGSPEKLVLVIRGDLLNQYPETVIFCQKAVAGATPEEPEIIAAPTDAQFKDHVKFPLFKAEVSPDIKLFGFDLTIEQAHGTAETAPFTGDTLGWFFCIAQPPGEARFGMDIGFDAGTDGVSWDDLAWTNFAEEIKFIKRTVVPEVPGLSVAEKARWAADAATMADILFQKPNLIAVHADQMLESLTN